MMDKDRTDPGESRDLSSGQDATLELSRVRLTERTASCWREMSVKRQLEG